MKVKKILDAITDIYHDQTYDRVPLETYIGYITDVLNMILLVRPDAHTVAYTHTLVDGVEQALPSDGFRLIDVAYNLDDMEKATSPIVKVDREILDNTDPTWMQHTDTEIYNYIYDPVRPKSFMVYPQAPGKKIKIYYSQAFPAITDVSDEVDIDEIFFSPIIDGALYFLYRIDSESSEFAVEKAQFHASMFNSALGLERDVGIAISPKGGK